MMISPLPQVLSLLKLEALVGCWYQGDGSERSRLSHHRLLVFLFLPLVSVFGRTGKCFLHTFHRLLQWMHMNRTRIISLDPFENVYVENVPLIRNFVCENMTCYAL